MESTALTLDVLTTAYYRGIITIEQLARLISLMREREEARNDS